MAARYPLYLTLLFPETVVMIALKKGVDMSEHVKMISEDKFDSTIQSGITLVDFYANWCGPCRTIAPHLESVAKELEGKASIIKIDVDLAQGVASTYGVTSIPTLILFTNGKEVNRIVGVRNAKEIKDFILSAAQ